MVWREAHEWSNDEIALLLFDRRRAVSLREWYIISYKLLSPILLYY